MNYANTVNWKYTMLNIKVTTGLSALSSLSKSGPGYPRQVRRKANAQRLQRAIIFYPAAFQLYHFVQHKNHETSI